MKVSRTVAQLLASGLVLAPLLVLSFPALAMKADLPAEAATPTPSANVDGLLTCINLDVVFIVDQSDSMSGEHGSANNDQYKLRELAPEAMIDLLAGFALDHCPEAVHRIAIVSFGNDKYVDMPLTEIAPDTLADSLKLRATLNEQVIATHLGETNPKPAFAEAIDILNQAGPVPGGLRKQLIIFVTDGDPCLKSSGCLNGNMPYQSYAIEMREQVQEALPFDTTLLAQDKCVNAVRGQFADDADQRNLAIIKCLQDYRLPDPVTAFSNSTYIYTLLLRTGQSYIRTVVDEYQAMSEEHGGKLIVLGNNELEVVPTMRTIISDLSGIEVNSISCGTFAVNPYLKQAKISISKLTPNVAITLSYKDAEGVIHQITEGQQGDSGGFTFVEPFYARNTEERYVFSYPYPGLWSLTADNCKGMNAYYDPLEINVGGYQSNLANELPEYDREPFYDPDSAKQFKLTYQMKDDTSRIIPEINFPEFKVKFGLIVTSPSGVNTTYAMQYQPTEDLFRMIEPLKLPEPGVYKIVINGSTLEHKGEPLVTTDSYAQAFTATRPLFHHETEFIVFEVTPFTISIVEPTDGATLKPIHGNALDGWPLPVKPIHVEAKIVQESGEPFDDLDSVLTTPESALTAQISAGGKLSNTIVLRPVPGSPGLYEGNVDNFDVEGEQTLSVSLNSGYNEQHRPYVENAQVIFQRSDLLINRVAFYYSALALLLSLALIAILYNIAIRTNKVRGTLIFADGKTMLAQLELAKGLNWQSFGQRELGPYPQLMLTKLKIVNRGRVGRATVQPDHVSGTMYGSGGHPGVRISGVTAGGRKFENVDLDPDLPMSYSEETMAQIIYRPPQDGAH